MKINFFGDFVIHSSNNIKISNDLRQQIKCADYNIINFEAPIHYIHGIKAPKSGPSLDQSNYSLQWLSEQSFNILSLANNHIMDYGEQGLNHTLSALQNFKYVGVGTWEEAYKPLILQNNHGLKVAIFSMAELQFGILYDEDNKNQKGCAWINHPSVNEIIKTTKKEVDFIVMIAHAGLEGEDLPLPEWRKRYKELIDVGCDVIIGGHTHTPQGYEIYKGKPIFYSLGNFCFEAHKVSSPKWYTGEMVSLELAEDHLTFKIYGTLFTKDTLKLIDSDSWNQNITHLNEILSHKYLEQINHICNQKLNSYHNLFSMGGHIHIDKRLFKSIIRYLLGRCNELHTLNNLQCETHRWTICRAIRNKQKLNNY